MSASQTFADSDGGSTPATYSSAHSSTPSRYVYSWQPLAGSDRCGGEAGTGCAVTQASCVGTDFSDPGGTYQAQGGTQYDRATSTTSDLGTRCADLTPTATALGAAPGAAPVVITVTRADFASLPVQPATAHAGPTSAVLPVGMDLVVYAEATDQTLDTTLLNTPVQVRAIPTSYTWDFGDGSTLTTTRPGQPYPHKDLAHTYQHHGWYDITLTTTYTGQYSVAGGPWQDIFGTIEIASAPIPLYSRSYESHLVNPEHPDAEEVEPASVPPRTPENAGPPAEHPTHRTD